MSRTSLLLSAAAAGLGLAFTIWPELDFAFARAVAVERDTAAYETVTVLRDVFRLVFTASCAVLVLAAVPLLFGGGIAVRPFSAAALFICTVVAVGAGLITNLIFKVWWGRARPHQVTEFGGDKIFSPIGIPSDQTSWNGSTPSGEAASIFALLFAIAAIAPKEWRRPLLTAGAAAGALAGIVRMAQLGHWASDVLAAGFLMAATAFGLRRLLVDHPNAPLAPLANLDLPARGDPASPLRWLTGPRMASLAINAGAWLVVFLVFSAPSRAEPAGGFVLQSGSDGTIDVFDSGGVRGAMRQVRFNAAWLANRESEVASNGC